MDSKTDILTLHDQQNAKDWDEVKQELIQGDTS